MFLLKLLDQHDISHAGTEQENLCMQVELVSYTAMSESGNMINNSIAMCVLSKVKKKLFRSGFVASRFSTSHLVPYSVPP